MTDTNQRKHGLPIAAVGVSIAIGVVVLYVMGAASAQTRSPYQSAEEARQKSVGCVTCHLSTDSPTMHPSGLVQLGCTDCHGGNAQVSAPPGGHRGEPLYARAMSEAHPHPKLAV